MNKPTTTELLNWAEGCKVKNALDCLLIVRSLIEQYGDGGDGKWKVERPGNGDARAISKDGKYILHLEEGTVFNEANADTVVALLNRGDEGGPKVGMVSVENLVKDIRDAGSFHSAVERAAKRYRKLGIRVDRKP